MIKESKKIIIVSILGLEMNQHRAQISFRGQVQMEKTGIVDEAPQIE